MLQKWYKYQSFSESKLGLKGGDNDNLKNAKNRELYAA
jgi:hypothetical protein